MASQESQSQSQPTVITLDNRNSAQILAQYVELAQTKGAYLLGEAELLKRAADFLLAGAQDAELNEASAKQLLIQGIHKGQRHGAYTLNDAALLSKVVQFVSGNLQASVPAAQPEPQLQSDSADLSDLAEPIPLKPKEV
jgi:polyhydroxyalkanoate synthesis regulator protein